MLVYQRVPILDVVLAGFTDDVPHWWFMAEPASWLVYPGIVSDLFDGP